MLYKLKKILKRPVYLLTSPASRGYLNWVPDKVYLKILYRLWVGKKLNLKNPTTYNEKMQWLKLYDKNPLKTVLTDKYLVREWIKENIPEDAQILNKSSNFQQKENIMKVYGVIETRQQVGIEKEIIFENNSNR